MDTFVLDWETFYDSKQGYTLKKMTTEEYINDPRFHEFGFSILKNGGNPIWVPEEKVETMLRQLKLHEHAVIAHNAPFDMAILNWKFGVKPKLIIDTLAMARAIHGPEAKLSLEALAEHYNLGQKGDAVLHMDGIRYPSTVMQKRLAEYAKGDARLTWGLWEKLRKGFPKAELVIIDITTRMFTEPSFDLDKSKVERELSLGETRKADLLLRANCELGDLRSDEKFAEVLRTLGIEPPMKSERFLAIAERMGKMPVALDYAGANTQRYAASSSAKVNMQNLPAARGSTDPDAALLRKSLVAPEGFMVGVSDLAQIEARLLVWQAGEQQVLSAFANNEDVYSRMASLIFNRHVDRKANPETDFIPGFIGKAVVLGCGYGLGHMKFGGMIYAGMLGMKGIFFGPEMAEQLNVDVREYVYYLTNNPEMKATAKESKPMALTPAEWIIHLACAQRIINMFRTNNPMIPKYWKMGEQMLQAMYLGTGETVGMFETRQDALLLPSGLWMHFKEIERNEDGEYSCLRRKEGRISRVKMYGGKVVENVTQALAGCVVKEAMVRMHARGFRPILQVHDEVVALVKEKEAKESMREIESCMTKVPSWATGLPLAAESDFAKSYGDAK
jgi:hypothetical protein